jgi:hypothetical protein
LVTQAGQVPYVAARPAELCFAEPVATPRPAEVAAGAEPGWEFLQPAAKLPAVGETPATARTTLRPNEAAR